MSVYRHACASSTRKGNSCKNKVIHPIKHFGLCPMHYTIKIKSGYIFTKPHKSANEVKKSIPRYMLCVYVRDTKCGLVMCKNFKKSQFHRKCHIHYQLPKQNYGYDDSDSDEYESDSGVKGIRPGSVVLQSEDFDPMPSNITCNITLKRQERSYASMDLPPTKKPRLDDKSSDPELNIGTFDIRYDSKYGFLRRVDDDHM